jgi:hypothetical protein
VPPTGPATARLRAATSPGRLAGEAGRVVAIIGLDDVHQVVADRSALLGRGLGGADVHPAVDLTGVDAHHLDRPVLAERDRQSRLADARRAEDREEGDGRRAAFERRGHRSHQVRRSSRLISPSGIRETIGRPCGQ